MIKVNMHTGEYRNTENGSGTENEVHFQMDSWTYLSYRSLRMLPSVSIFRMYSIQNIKESKSDKVMREK